MPTNQAFTLTYKNKNNLNIPIEIKTVKEQVLNWNYGNIYHIFNVALLKDNWKDNVQKIPIKGIKEDIIPIVSNILTNTVEIKKTQYEAFQKIIKVESKKEEVYFFCSEIPDVDLKIQIYWVD